MSTLLMPSSVGLKAFEMEIYLKNPATGVTGWDISNIRVFATDREAALMLVKSYKNFDCVIDANNYADDLDDTDLKFTNQGLRFRKI